MVRRRLKILMFFWAIVTCLIVSYPMLLKQIQCSSGISADSHGRDIVKANIDYEHLWDYKTSLLNAVDLIDDLVIFSDSACYKVVTVNIETGDTTWSVSYRANSISAASTRNHVYVETLDTKELVALDENGKQIWKNTAMKGQHGGIKPYALSNGSLVASIPHELVIVDPSTGEFGNVIPLPDYSFIIGGEYFWRVGNGQLIARDAQSANIVWRSEYQGMTQCCLKQVTVTSEHIALLFAGKVITLDRKTGALIWETAEDQIVSNFVVMDGKVVFLNIDATLFFLNESTGETLATVQFIPPTANARDMRNNDGVIGNSKLVAADDVLVIYFGDTDMLSAYRFDLESMAQP
jgi:outer membrane protein assembly factor BamB